MGIFDKRVAFKPFEYPEVMGYIDAVNQSYWVKDEFSFTGDVQDYHVKLTDAERGVVRNTLLAISQIEVSVKSFWGRLGDRFPKPEFHAVGATFSESEVRHERAYSHLLEVLGLNNAFATALEHPVMKGRVAYLTKYLKGGAENTDQGFTLSLALFSLFVENVSLFTQFAVIKSFNKERNLFKDIDNVIQATAREETLHALLGIYIINQVKAENPDWFNADFYQTIDQACRKAYEAEAAIIDWIFETGELDFLTKDTLLAFTKQRFNDSVRAIGGQAPFVVDEALLAPLNWFTEELLAPVHVDFFHKKSTNYAKFTQVYDEDSLF